MHRPSAPILCAILGALSLAGCDRTEELVTPDMPTEPEDSIQRWSDPSVWPAGVVPEAGQPVLIPEGTSIVLDVSPPPLGGLRIEGELVAARRDLDLTADWILVSGLLQVGDDDAPFTDRLRITLTGALDGEEAAVGMGNRLIGVLPGGALEIRAESRTAWTRLDGTVAPGASSITVSGQVDWRVGERLVVAPSGFDPREAEDRAITAVSGRTLTLDQPLEHPHFGEVQSIAGRSVDQRAEVGLLSRTVTIRGLGVDAEGVVSAEQAGSGGHIMVLAGGEARFEGVELVHMGQSGRLARYPVHWHLLGEGGGQYLRNSAVWRTNNRCVTVHGTDHVEVADNVCYDHFGHGYFLEEGGETGNRLVNNLGIFGRRTDGAARLIPSDDRPATFWITNPDNHLEGNVAAGSQGFGFWYALPDRPLGPSAGEPDRPRRTPLGVFRDNVAHSNQRGGLHVDHGPGEDGVIQTTSYRPILDPLDNDSEVVPAVFESLLAYKNRPRGVWLRGHGHLLTNAILADNQIGATFASSESFIEDALVIGETANNASRVDVYRGFEFYDGRVGARRVTFEGFSGAGSIPWSALGYNRKNAFSVHTGNVAEDLEFIDSRPVYIEDPQLDKDGDKGAVFLDALGAVSGTPGAWVVASTPFLETSGCTMRAEWNARICPGPYVRLILSASSAFAPLEVVRDDGAAEEYVGIGNNPARTSKSLVVNRRYRLETSADAPDLQINLRDARPGEWLVVELPLSSAPSQIVRDYWAGHPMTAGSSRAQVESGDGSVFWYDAGQRRLHLKLAVRDDRNWAHFRLVP